MKRALLIAMGLICLACLGCYQPTPPPVVDNTKISQESAGPIIVNVLGSYGVNVSCSVKDLNGDGIPDYYFIYTGGMPNLDKSTFLNLVMGVTISIREVSKKGNFYAKDAYLEIGGLVFHVSIADLFYCEQFSDQADCVLSVWREVPTN